ncbi:MAG: copper-binding protein [Rhizobacter sp.]|nr:copper-binding protein [Rhizobacter sp.]
MKLVQVIAASGLALAFGIQAQTASAPSPADHAAHHPPGSSSTPATAPWVDAEVRKIDTGAGKLTLRHGQIQNLDMPPMTMVFKVADAKLLQGLKEGDKVRFTADKLNGAYTVTAISSTK